MKDQKQSLEGGRRVDGPHVEDRLPAWVDSRLAAEESARVRAHCLACPACHQALREMEALCAALDAAAAPVLSRPLWPLVTARLERDAPRLRLALRLGAAAAAVAGVFLGALLGSPRVGDEHSWQQETWAQIGSLLEDDEATLDNIYLSLADQGGEEQ